VSEGVGDRRPGSVASLVEDLVGRVEALHAEVIELKSVRSASADAGGQVPPIRRTLPTGGDPVDLSVLAEWVESLIVRYAAAGDWLRPCWWRHGFVVEELAALRAAWLAVYDASEAVDPTAGVRWHDEAERCQERIRRTISAGPGCSAVAHKPDEPITEDSRWNEELAALRNQSPRHLEVELFPATNPGQGCNRGLLDPSRGDL
jgi:hypothetical protein